MSTPRLRLSAIALSATGAVLLAACATAPAPGAPATGSATTVSSAALEARVVLAPASGSLVSGTLNLTPMGGVHVRGEIGGLKPGGVHAFHIHETGDCSAADASSSGGHFNPGGQPHGRAGQGAHHAGDADNLVANARGVATVDAHFAGVTLGGDGRTDVIGRAVVVHAAPDDYRSQPAGNAGARVACGVIRRVR
jgi:Cu-Zn family superoxide dismutase